MSAHLKTLGRYEIQEEIGRGTMGVVYKALDPALGRPVALKTVRLAFSISPEEADLFERRFLREARVAARLSHPGIVVVHDVGRDPSTGILFIALEYLQGRTLAEIAARGERLEWSEALRVTARVAEALHHAHSQGVVHRDVKPANIMVLPTGEPKIMDFGIAKAPAGHLTAAGELFGTPSYMSPEQAAGAALDGRSDLFSLGTVLYLLLTGRPAFRADTIPGILARVTHHDPPPPSALAPHLPPAVDDLVRRALAKKPEDRYTDGRAFAEDIEDVRAGGPPRHRAGWIAPPPAEATLVSSSTFADLEAAPRPLTGPAGPLPEGGPPARRRARPRRRGILALGGLAAALVIAGLLLPGDRPTLFPLPSFPLPGLTTPGRLRIDLEHHLKQGTLRVWIDDRLALQEALESRVVKKVLTLPVRKGSVSRVLEVTPGEHVVRVQIDGDGVNASGRIRGSFESGVTRRLDVGLTRLTKEVSLEWGS